MESTGSPVISRISSLPRDWQATFGGLRDSGDLRRTADREGLADCGRWWIGSDGGLGAMVHMGAGSDSELGAMVHMERWRTGSDSGLAAKPGPGAGRILERSIW